jgi:hypothetical protein
MLATVRELLRGVKECLLEGSTPRLILARRLSRIKKARPRPLDPYLRNRTPIRGPLAQASLHRALLRHGILYTKTRYWQFSTLIVHSLLVLYTYIFDKRPRFTAIRYQDKDFSVSGIICRNDQKTPKGNAEIHKLMMTTLCRSKVYETTAVLVFLDVGTSASASAVASSSLFSFTPRSSFSASMNFFSSSAVIPGMRGFSSSLCRL